VRRLARWLASLAPSERALVLSLYACGLVVVMMIAVAAIG
jgi:hypothetical protein